MSLPSADLDLADSRQVSSRGFTKLDRLMIEHKGLVPDRALQMSRRHWVTHSIATGRQPALTKAWSAAVPGASRASLSRCDSGSPFSWLGGVSAGRHRVHEQLAAPCVGLSIWRPSPRTHLHVRTLVAHARNERTSVTNERRLFHLQSNPKMTKGLLGHRSRASGTQCRLPLPVPPRRIVIEGGSAASCWL